MWFSFPGWPLGMYIKYPGSSEKKSVAKLFLDQKVRGNKSHPSILKNYKFKSVVDLVSRGTERESQSEMEKVSLFPKLGKNKK